MIAIANYTLPAIQILYQLLALSNVTNSVPALDQSPPQDQPRILPKGYVGFPAFGMAFKFHQEPVTWLEAKYLCKQGGARMTVIDSVEKVAITKIPPYFASAHAGIVRMTKDRPWISVRTGSELSSFPCDWDQSSTENGNCVQFVGDKMSNFDCTNRLGYVCEIPILPVLVDNTITPN